MITYFLCRQGAHDSGTRFRFRTTLNWSSGDLPVPDEPVEGEVNSISDIMFDIVLYINMCDVDRGDFCNMLIFSLAKFKDTLLLLKCLTA